MPTKLPTMPAKKHGAHSGDPKSVCPRNGMQVGPVGVAWGSGVCGVGAAGGVGAG